MHLLKNFLGGEEMKKFLRNFKKPLLTFMLMLAVLVPIISSVFINAEDQMKKELLAIVLMIIDHSQKV